MKKILQLTIDEKKYVLFSGEKILFAQWPVYQYNGEHL